MAKEKRKANEERAAARAKKKTGKDIQGMNVRDIIEHRQITLIEEIEAGTTTALQVIEGGVKNNRLALI